MQAKRLLLYAITLLNYFCNEAAAQHAYFPLQGKIRFEKEVYLKARMREMMNGTSGRNPGRSIRFGSNIDNIPEKTSSMFKLRFDANETLMTPEETDTPKDVVSTRRAARNNRNRATSRSGQHKVYYQNLHDNTTELELELDERYLLHDSLQQITWRFTDEYRNIAGYDCRRVNGATPDSLYIIAFYTDQIPVSGGPALVHGLPGMILGLAIPEMHINYWAKSVDFLTEDVPRRWRDSKSKVMTMEDFFNALGNNRFWGGGTNTKQRRRNLMENLIY